MAIFSGKARAIKTNDYARLAFFSTLAGSLAFLAGVIAPNISGVVAAITALLTTRSAFHESIQEGGRQIVGTIAGAIIGGILLSMYGFNIAILVISLAVAYALGRLLRLGEEGAITIAVTVILVLGLNLDGDAVESRVLGVVAGAAIALLISLFVAAENPQDVALKKAIDYSHRISSLLDDISGALHKRANGISIPVVLAQGWLKESEEIRGGIEVLSKEAESIVKGARWSPLIQRTKADQILEQCKIGAELSVTVEGMCRELMVANGGSSLSDTVALHLSEMFGAAADAVMVQAAVAKDSPAQTVSPAASSLQGLSSAQSNTRTAVKNLDETSALMLGGSLAQDGETIKKILTESDPQD